MILFGRKRRILSILVFPAILFSTGLCSKGGSDKTGRCGTVVVVYDSGACECIRERGETILHQVDSLKIADPLLDKYFVFQQVDRAKDRKTADAILDRCDSHFIPVVRIEDPRGKTMHEFSFEFDTTLFMKILEVSIARAST